MAAHAVWSLIIVLLFDVSVSTTLTYDEDATNDAIAASSGREDVEVAITMRAPKGSMGREELLHAKDAADNVVSLFYDSNSNKVSLESLNNGHLRYVSWNMGSHKGDSLILVVTHKKVRLYIGCKALRWHSMPGRHDVINVLASKKLKLYHEENAPIDIFDSERIALDSIQCLQDLKPPSLVTVDSDVEEVKDFIRKEEIFKHEEEMQGDDYRTNYIDPNILPPLPQPGPPTTQRGDIPAMEIESCDDEIIRQLKLLRQTIELLRRELGDQKGTIDALRNQLRACCSRMAPQPVDRCSGSSCYQGY